MGDQGTAYPRWASDSQVLAEIGRELYSQPTRVTVRLSKTLADQARAAWERDDDDPRRIDDETPDAHASRHRAGALALVGLAVAEQGKEDGDGIVVELDAWVIGDSLTAADEVGLLLDAPAAPHTP